MRYQTDKTVGLLRQEASARRSKPGLLQYAEALVEIADIYEASGLDYRATLAQITRRIAAVEASHDIWTVTSMNRAVLFFRTNWTAPGRTDDPGSI